MNFYEMMNQQMCKDCCCDCDCCGKQDGYGDMDASLEFVQEVIELLHNVLEDCTDEMIRTASATLQDGDFVALVIETDGNSEIMSSAECKDSYGEDYDFDEMDYLEEYDLLVSYDGSCVVTLGGTRYLVDAPVLVYELDENVNECSINRKTMEAATGFQEENSTEIVVDGMMFPAIRLGEE